MTDCDRKKEPKIFNLSNRKLSTNEIKLLTKGLKFTPTPHSANIQELQSDVAEFHRKIRLKEFFHDKHFHDDSLVRNKSNFQPQKGRNIVLDSYIEFTKTIPKQSNQKTNFNLSLQEQNAIKSLKEDETIVIKEADKGGGIVIMNKKYYKTQILNMLQDDTFYKLAETIFSKYTFKKIQNLIKETPKITKHEIDYLLDFEYKSSSFYGLPKIHKSKLIKQACTKNTGEYIEYLDPEDLKFRPIIAGPICETHRLSNLIDILLKPFVTNVKSYVRDDIDFLQYIPEKVPTDSYLISFDVTSLYTNISHQLGVKAISYWLDKYPNFIHHRFSKEFILKGLKIILENNNFNFNGKTYNQIKGTAMGTKCAPTYATLVLGFLEEKLYKQTREIFSSQFSTDLETEWKRYLDDCFMFWKHSIEDLHKFFNLINKLHPDITFTMETNKNALPFLDILLIKKGSEIQTDIFFKETDTKQYLNFKSCHPKHIKNNIPYNLARRICTIVSSPNIKNKRLDELKKSLVLRQYPKKLIEYGIEKAVKLPRTELLKVHPKENKDIIPYISTFNPNNPEMFGIFKNNINFLHLDKTMNQALKDTSFIKSKRQPPNLKRILTKAEFQDKNKSKMYHVKICGRPNCSLCQYMPEGHSYNFNGKIFYVNANMTCNVKNVIYVITCPGCNEFYIGQTGDKLRTRRTVHAQQIRDPATRQLPLSTHLDRCTKNDIKFKIFPFYKLKSENLSIRISKENHFIKCFKPKLNN